MTGVEAVLFKSFRFKTLSGNTTVIGERGAYHQAHILLFAHDLRTYKNNGTNSIICHSKHESINSSYWNLINRKPVFLGSINAIKKFIIMITIAINSLRYDLFRNNLYIRKLN